MNRDARQTGERKTRRAIVKLLKTEGPLGSAQLAERLGLTAMAVRLHLCALQSEGLVAAEDRPSPVGRPAKSWRLTREGDRHFPEAYAELSVALIDAMQETFGAEGLNRVLVSRCARQREEYAKRIRPTDSLKKRLAELARVRTGGGDMAGGRAGGGTERRAAPSLSRTTAPSARRRTRVRASARRSWTCSARRSGLT